MSKSSVSFGLVGIRFQGVWRGISCNIITVGSSNLADLMCVSMGFQKAVPGSIKSVAAMNNFSFSVCQSKYVNT